MTEPGPNQGGLARVTADRSGCGTLGVPQLRRAERVDLIFAAQFPVAVLAGRRHCHRYSGR
jgi:hypothetical protein